jgi:hypothetical protein
MWDEFYSCYLHCIKGKALTVSTLFRHFKDENRRIYVSDEHLTLFREARKLKKMNMFSRVLTREGGVSVILLNGDEQIPSDAGKLMKLTYGRVGAFECWCLIFICLSFFTYT